MTKSLGIDLQKWSVWKCQDCSFKNLLHRRTGTGWINNGWFSTAVSTIYHSLSIQISIHIPEPSPLKYFYFNDNNTTILVTTFILVLENTVYSSISSIVCLNFLEIDSRLVPREYRWGNKPNIALKEKTNKRKIRNNLIEINYRLLKEPELKKLLHCLVQISAKLLKPMLMWLISYHSWYVLLFVTLPDEKKPVWELRNK